MFNSTQEYADYQQLLSELSTVGRNTPENQTIFADFASRYNRILNLTTANFHTLSALVVPKKIADQRFCRMVRRLYSTSPLSSVGSKVSSGRFHIKNDIPTIYLGEDETVCVSEIGSKGLPTGPIVSFPVIVKLQKILDISDAFKCEQMGFYFDFVSEEWEWIHLVLGEHIIHSYTQHIGQLAQKNGFEGIFYESVRHRGKFNVALFPENLLCNSYVSLLGEESELKDIDLSNRKLTGYLAPIETNFSNTQTLK